MWRDLAAQRLRELLRAGLDAWMRQRCQLGRIIFASDESVKDRPTTQADDTADDAAELYVRILERLLDALRVLRDLTNELLPRSSQIPHLLYRRRWHEAATDEAMRKQVRQPHRVVLVGFSSGHIPDVLRVGE